MWQQLAMAGVKSLADENNRRNDLASNVITQKYSPWTGARADFSSQGKNKTMQNMIAGYGAGRLQDLLDEQRNEEKMAAQKAEWKDDSDFYSRLSADPSSVGVSAIGGKGGGFGAIANKGPAATGTPSQGQVPMSASSFSAPGFTEEDSYVMANRAPSSFLSQIGVNEADLKSSMANTPAQQSFNPWGNLAQQLQRPLTPQEAQMPEFPKADPTAPLRQAIYGAIPDSVPLKYSDTGSVPRSAFTPAMSDLASQLRGKNGDFMNEQPRIYSPMQFPKLNPNSRRPF